MMAAGDARLAALQRITQMILDAELAKLRMLSEDVATHRAEIEKLAAARATRAAAVKAAEAGTDLAFDTGQDARWWGWTADARERLSREMSQAATRAEAQRLLARRAFGRAVAVERIAAKQDAERNLRASRRAEVRTAEPGDGC